MQIYKTTNLIDSKIYIGKDTKTDLNYLGSGIRLKNAIKKYGIHSFKKEILEDGITDKKILSQREIYWIAYFNSNNRLIGYNLTKGGDGGDTITNNPNRNKILDKKRGKTPWNKGLKIDKLCGERNGNYGNPTGFKGNKTTFKSGNLHPFKGKKQSKDQIKKRVGNIDYNKRTKSFPWEQKAKKCMKPILQLDLEGNIIRHWESATTAAKELNINRERLYFAMSNDSILLNYKWKRFNAKT
jgi:group I intron endonuclease